MKLSINIALLFIILILQTSNSFGQKFKKMEKNIKEKESIPNAYNNDNEADNSSMEVITELITMLLYSFPNEDDLREVYGTPLRLSKYTYSGASDGRYTRNPEEKSFFAWDLQANYFYESNSIQGFQAFTRIQFIPKFSFDINYSHLQEKVVNEDPYYFDFLHADISFHRFAFTRFDLWIGTGLTSLWLEDNYTGWNFNIGSEIFIKKPVSIYTHWYFGGLEEVNFTEGAIDLKVYLNRCNLFIGYQYFEVAGVVVQGGRAGLGFTF